MNGMVIGDMELIVGRGRAVGMAACEAREPEVEVCHNLRAANVAGRQVLVSAAEPQRVADSGCVPLCRLGGGMLVRNGQLLSYLDREGVHHGVARVAAGVLSAVHDGDGALVHLSDGERLRVVAGGDGDYHAMYEQRQYAPLAVLATDISSERAEIAGRKLTGSYPHTTGPLSAGDRDALEADVCDAWGRALGQAAAAGYYSQPVLVRYRLLDAQGAPLYVSPVKIVGCDGGFQGRKSINVYSDDSMATRAGGMLSVDTYRLGVIAPADPGDGTAGGVVSMVVECSGPLHSVSADKLGSVTVSTDSRGRVTIAARLLGSERRDAVQVTVKNALEQLEELMHPVARFDNPYGGGIGVPGSVAVIVAPARSGERRAVAAAPRYMSIERRIAHRCSAPHSFVAHGVSADSDLVVWREPEYRLALPGRLTEFAAAVSDNTDTRWRAWVSVTMADGSERVVSSEGGTGAQPLLLSGLLCYPSADARRMTVCINSDGRTVRKSVPLTPCVATDMAWWLSADGIAVEIDEEVETFAVPSTSARLHRCVGTLLVADGTMMQTPLNAIRVGATAVRDVVRDAPGSSLWDKTRSRRRVVCDDGVYLLSIGADRGRTGLRRICGEHPQAWCVSERGEMYVWVTGGVLVSVGDRSCRRLSPVLPSRWRVTAMGWNGVQGRLTMLCSDGVLAEYDPDGGWIRTRDIGGAAVTALYGIDGCGLCAATAGGLYDLENDSDEVSAGGERSRWLTVGRGAALRCLVADVRTDGMGERTIEVYGELSAGSRAPVRLVRERIRGALCGAHRVLLPSPPVDRVCVIVK